MTAQRVSRSPNPDDRATRPSTRTHRAALATCAGLTRLALVVIAKVKIVDADVHPVVGHGVIIAINHRSVLDFCVSTIAFRRWRIYPHTLARADFFARPFLGQTLRLLGAIPAGRGRGAAVTLSETSEVLRHGGVITIAPEGRIVASEQRSDGLGDLKGGTGVMSSQRGTPILLTAITNTDLAWPLGRRLPVLHLPWNRPTIMITVAWMQVAAGTAPSDVTDRVAHGLRGLLTLTEHASGHP